MVYVLNIDGRPLMPTERHGKVRRMLREGLAKVVNRCPFTIQLLYGTTNETQNVALGVDTGSKHIGLSATTEKKELFSTEVELRTDILKLLASRRELRSVRRNRKCRYRIRRFLNRIRTKKKGWLAPSVWHRLETHLQVIAKVFRLLPVSKIVVETASFDIQKIKNPDIQGEEYQQGQQLGFWNVREYVLFRDGHVCQNCKGKTKDSVLNVHHIESRQTGGNSPDNLVTLCETCHNKFHKGLIKLPETIRRDRKFDAAAFMGIMRWALYDKLKSLYGNVAMTFGYITKHIRIQHGLPKSHHVDARCITGNLEAIPLGYCFYMKKVRCHNRQIHKLSILKGGYRKANQAPYMVKGFRLNDVVFAKGRLWYIHSRRVKGSFILKNLAGESLEITSSKIKLVGMQRGYVVERRAA